MESSSISTSHPAPSAARHVSAGAGVLAAGLLFGIATPFVPDVLPFPPFTMIGDSSALWCAAALGVGAALARLRTGFTLPAGALFLVASVVGYYGFVVAVLPGPAALADVDAWLVPAWAWLAAACVAGPVLALAGTWLVRDVPRPLRLGALGLLGAVFLAESLGVLVDEVTLVLLGIPMPPDDGWRLGWYVNTAVQAVVGLVLPLVASRRGADRLPALGVALLMALVWYVGIGLVWDVLMPPM
ncbi:DUF6518 family protein [Nocardiopsis lucentensis]|uniref:DUF6518 family protein n=1 Tax=Nocardiopsis lucentensis TaxID=53441 RepID=UPI000348265D|nr:DUF6518 family protein [Nocardiopsis lucentensis]